MNLKDAEYLRLGQNEPELMRVSRRFSTSGATETAAKKDILSLIEGGMGFWASDRKHTKVPLLVNFLR